MRPSLARPVSYAIAFAIGLTIITAIIVAFIVVGVLLGAFVTWTAPAITLATALTLLRVSVAISAIVTVAFLRSEEGREVRKSIYKDIADAV